MILRDPEAAVDALERAHQNRDAYVIRVNVNRFFDHLRGNTRYRAILEDMGYPVIPQADAEHVGHNHELMPTLGEDTRDH